MGYHFSRLCTSRNALIRCLRFPLRFIPGELAIPVLQGCLKGKRWLANSCNYYCWLGCFEYDKHRLFECLLKEGDVVFDIGAHVGYYALSASVLVGPTGRVYAFEPLPRNFRYLVRHITINKVGNVEPIEVAVSDQPGSAYFKEGSDSLMGSVSPEGRLRVRTVSLDDFVLHGAVRTPSVVKIDVEGGEFDVLLGARSVLSATRPILFLATHGSAIHQRCCSFLVSLGYALEPIASPELTRSDEIVAYDSEGMPQVGEVLARYWANGGPTVWGRTHN